MPCPFCEVPEAERIIETDLVIGFDDRFPVSPGHVLLIPKRHVATWFEASDEERRALMRAVDHAVRLIPGHSSVSLMLAERGGPAGGPVEADRRRRHTLRAGEAPSLSQRGGITQA